MGNKLIGSLFIFCIATFFCLYFFGINKFFNPVKQSPSLLEKFDVLHSDEIYFRQDCGDTSEIFIFQCVGKFNSDKYAIKNYLDTIHIPSKAKDMQLEEFASELVSFYNSFIINVNSPSYSRELQLIDRTAINNWIENGKILRYPIEKNLVDELMYYGNSKIKYISFLFLTPFGYIILLLFLSLIFRLLRNLLNSIPNKWLANMIIIGISSLFFMLFVHYVSSGSRDIVTVALVSFIFSIITRGFYVYISKKIHNVTFKQITQFFLILLIPIFLFALVGLLSYAGKSLGITQALSNKEFILSSLYYMIVIGFPFAFADFINNVIDLNIEKKIQLSLMKEEQKEAQMKAIELDNLMTRINPHFLYNGLNTIASLTTTDCNKAAKMTYSLANFYKYASNRKNKIFNNVKEEIDILSQYLNIEKLRFGDQLHFELEIDKTTNNVLIPYMIFQPLVENAIKHGFSSETKSILIKLKLVENEDGISIFIFDSGRQFDESLENGFGILSVKRKLELLYGSQFKMQFFNSPNKHVFLQIPKNID